MGDLTDSGAHRARQEVEVVVGEGAWLELESMRMSRGRKMTSDPNIDFIFSQLFCAVSVNDTKKELQLFTATAFTSVGASDPTGAYKI